MKKIVLFGVALAVFCMWLPGAQAATEAEIEEAIQNGLDWLVAQQDAVGGHWPHAYGDLVPTTGLAVLKLCDRANELEEYESPFDPDYPYHENVEKGLDYLFSQMVIVGIGPQTHGNPDTDGDQIGVRCGPNQTYDTGIVLAAISATETPGRTVGAIGSAVDGWTYLQVAQDMVDWLAYAQTDAIWDYPGANDCGRGGWYYEAANNAARPSDNSNSGYATLGLGYALGFGCTIPGFVLTELNQWIGCIQDPVNGDPDDGGSWYRNIGDTDTGIGTNLLKTGNLVLEMLLAGDSTDPPTARIQDALDYMARHWGASVAGSWPKGWDANPAEYQAMFLIMKGLEAGQFEELPGPIDWFAELADSIVAQQIPQDHPNPAIRGSWQSTAGTAGSGYPVVITDWALLTLEKVTPVIEIEVYVDIKPTSCPNPLNTNSQGVLPVAILGTEDFDVAVIDPSTVMLEGVAPLRWNYEDVATPFMGELCDCHELGADGYMDMTLKFKTQDMVAAIEAMPNDVLVPAMQYVNAGPDGELALVVGPREYVRLTLTGMTYDGIPISGQDCVRVMWKTRGPHDGPDETGGPDVSGGTAPPVTLDVRYLGSLVSGTRITFGLPEPAHVTLSVYDVAGRRVKTLVNQTMPGGVHSVNWNGKDEAGISVASGVYFIKMSAPGIDRATKLIIVE